MTLKGSGESFAQIAAEKANPKLDVWFGGTGDPHLQAAEQGLLEEYKSPMLAQLQPWAQKQAEQSKYRTVGIYLGALGIGYNTELLAKKKVAAPACWKDLVKPEFAGEVQMANPNASGTAYTAIATLVQVFGEEEAFKYLKALHKNINNYPRSGVAPIKAAARGENARERLVHPRRRHRGAGRLSGQGRRALRRHRLRDRLAVDRQGRAQPRQREEVRRLGADARRRRRWARRRSSSRSRRTSARRSRRCRRSSPTSSSSTTISRSTARRPSASACSSAGTRKSAPSPNSPRSGDNPPGPRPGAAVRRLESRMIRRLARRRRCRDRPRSPPLPAAGQLNLYCSSPNTAWCQGMAIGFEKATGIKVAVVQKATGEMLAQVKAERANPKGDIWWAGPARRVPAGGRGRPARDLPVAEPHAAARLGAAHLRGLAEPRVRRLRRHPRARLQHRAAGEEEAAGPEVLEGPARSRATRTR